MKHTKIVWLNRFGQLREHYLGGTFSYTYALDWFRRSIVESQGVLSLDERRTSKLMLVGISNHLQ
jgi:hypothetical protein